MSAANSALFTPIKIGRFQLNHRVVLAPLTRFRATTEAIPTDINADYYKQRTTRYGLLITEATFISPLAGGYPQAPGIYTQAQIESWKKVTEVVHQKKGIIFLQLWHIGRAGSRFLNPNQEQVVSASDIPIRGKNFDGSDTEVPRALTVDEIKLLVQDYRQAALNAMEAGFDGVEIHGANGFLIDQFINSSSNKRIDQYGGSIENRTRFALEIVDAIVDAVGAERTAIRLSPGSGIQDVQDDTPVETWGYLISQLQQSHPDLAYLHLVEPRGDVFADKTNSIDTLEPYRKIWKGPLVVASGFSTNIPHAIDLAEKTGDLVAFGRAFIANPDLPERILNGWKLNQYDRSTFYTHDALGYTDYPYYDDKN
ncbi:12-oxophytodienoate reductase 1 [Choanephora cucurbitarum]|uniref:12-oxophytodienoate reductase 1 n=1 Tax=Choanephora cucurbitarum TaxID=101091 RepID=A0A1C7NJC8_9FUNG|nr:12-oxophytodienoate reductase 1 [Choanephora cucurbitarum]